MPATAEAPFVPLRSAQVCLDCNAITSAQATCPACAGRQLWPLSSWLNRDADAEAKKFAIARNLYA